MTTPEDSEYLTIREAAERARRTEKAMRQLRARNQGPRVRKVDGRLLVRSDDLSTWLAGDEDPNN